MRSSRLRSVLAVVAAVAVCLWAAGTAGADSPSGGQTSTAIEVFPPAQQVSGQQNVTLSARLRDGEGRALSGQALGFFVLTDVFSERLMKVDDVLTDPTGTASLLYQPTWEGEHTVVVRYPGSDDYAPAQTAYSLDVVGPVPVHHNASFGLDSVRPWVPLGVGTIVLTVWATLGLVMARTVFGLPGAARTAEPLPGPALTLEPLYPVPLRGALVLVIVLLLMAFPVAWLVTRDGDDEVYLAVEDSTIGGTHLDEHMPLDTGRALPATLAWFVPAVTMDENGQLTGDSADLPAEVALMDGRVFVLDTNNGRILVVRQDRKFAPIFQSDLAGSDSLLGATAMAAHDEELYVASSQSGNVVVLSSAGRVERVVAPQVPEGQEPLRPAGIAVTEGGDIWLSDAANHRVLLLDENGRFLVAIGQGVQSSGEYGFDTPRGLAVDGEGNLLVVDTGNRLVKKYSPMGVYLGEVGQDQLAEPQAVAVDEAGKVFATDASLVSVLVFGPDGAYLGTVGHASSASGESNSWFQVPYGLEVDGDSLYVVDRLAGLMVLELGGGGGS
jgi:sugar lactone lactonase YvrE